MSRKTSQSAHRRPRMISFGQAGVRWFFRVLLTLAYRIRVHGLKNYPAEDRMLICANHQSYLDPLVMGVVCPRPVNYLARKTLFRKKKLARFLLFNDAIPIDRDATGLAGVKETLKRLKRGESVVMFPEGTRTADGDLQGLMPGFSLLARRSKAALLPVGVDGCYQAYSREKKIPRPGHIHAVFGQPIKFEEYESLSDEETALLLEERMRTCFEEAHRRWLDSR